MSKESKPKRTRSTKKVSESPQTAELEAKIAQLEAKLANLSSQVKTPETRPAAQAAKPASAPAPKPRPAASGPTHGTLPAGMKPTPPPAPKEEPRSESYSSPQPGEVAPAYAQISSTGYTGNKYYATRARLSYHPANKQFKGQASTGTSTYSAPPPPPPAPKPQRGTLPAGMKPAEQHTAQTEAEKKSMWKAKGAEYENYVPEEETHRAPPPPPEPKAQRGTLPAGFESTPPPAPKEAPKPAPAPAPKPRPAASGPTHGTLPAGMKPTPPPQVEAPRSESHAAPEPGEVAPAYAQISSTGYTGNKYYATRRRLSYHPPNKQFTGSASAGMTEAPPAPAPKKVPRGTLPAGFKP